MPYLTIKRDENGVPTIAKTFKDATSGKRSIVPSDNEVESYIREAAKKRGVDPNEALVTWAHEGKGHWWAKGKNKQGKPEPSAGPYQFLKGGEGTGFPTGLGNQFEKDTGLDPHDPANWKATVDYAFDTAAKDPRGWFGHWYGRRNAGKDAVYLADSATPMTRGRFGVPQPGVPVTPAGDVLNLSDYTVNPDLLADRQEKMGRFGLQFGGGFGSKWRNQQEVDQYGLNQGIPAGRLEAAPPRSAEIRKFEAPTKLNETVQQLQTTTARPTKQELGPTAWMYTGLGKTLNIGPRMAKKVKENPQWAGSAKAWMDSIKSAKAPDKQAELIRVLSEMMQSEGY